MYRNRYAEIVADDQGEARRNEVRALDVVIGRLEVAREAEGDEAALETALLAMETLWSIFMAEIASPGNALPIETRRGIFAVGTWIFARSADLRESGVGDIGLLIDVNAAIRSGLLANS